MLGTGHGSDCTVELDFHFHSPLDSGNSEIIQFDSDFRKGVVFVQRFALLLVTDM